MEKKLNQCDGCRAGYPLNIYGHHILPSIGYSVMNCQADRYGCLPFENTRKPDGERK